MTEDVEGSPNSATLASYDAAAHLYANRMHEPQPAFVNLLDRLATLAPDGGTVLELGSGTGRDADLLEARGLRVRRTDGSPAFVTRMQAAQHEADVLNVLRDDLGGPYDAVFASAVFLHLTKPELDAVLAKAAGATRAGGLLVFTVKEGDGEAWTTVKLGLRRHFTYWRAPELTDVLADSPWDLVSLEHVPGREDDWLYAICRRAAN